MRFSADLMLAMGDDAPLYWCDVGRLESSGLDAQRFQLRSGEPRLVARRVFVNDVLELNHRFGLLSQLNQRVGLLQQGRCGAIALGPVLQQLVIVRDSLSIALLRGMTFADPELRVVG